MMLRSEGNVERKYEPLLGQDIVLWLLFIVNKKGHKMTYTRLQKIIYELQDELKDKIPGLPRYNFQEFLYGPFDSKLQREVSALIYNRLAINGINNNWKANTSVPAHDIYISKLGIDYVERIILPLLRKALREDELKLFRKRVTDDYMMIGEWDLIVRTWKKWIDKNPDEEMAEEARNLLGDQ